MARRMTKRYPRPLACAAALVAATASLAAIDVKVVADKTFDLTRVATWNWDPEGPGVVKMARTASDDPEATRKRVEPVIVDAVRTELASRGLRPASALPADLIVRYYLLLTTGVSAQTMGQFVDSSPEWGLPPFAPATTSMEFINRGSLVIDMRSGSTVVWRGVADSKVAMDLDDRRREKLLRDAVRDLVRRFPKVKQQ